MELTIELQHVISQYFKNTASCEVRQFGSGLINRTFFLRHAEGDFLLQKINHQVFQKPEGLMQNIQLVSEHLQKKKYPRSILTIQPTLSGDLFYKNKNGAYWRIFIFFGNTRSYDLPSSNEMVYQAAKGFGEFLFYLKDIPKEQIDDTIPDFHNTPLRFQQLTHAISNDNANRAKRSEKVISKLMEFSFLIKKIKNLENEIPNRIIHNDLKINNLLFNSNNEIEAVIDWDTIMNGNILYDFGDMVRTMACTENEESTNFSKVKINQAYLKEIVSGFSESTFSFLTKIEKEHLLQGAPFIIFEQAIRFLTDHLNGDIYYNITYTNQNLNRTINQLTLLEDFLKTAL